MENNNSQQNISQIMRRSDTRRWPQPGHRNARLLTVCPHAGHGFSSFGFPAGGVGCMSCPHVGQAFARLLTPCPHAGQAFSHDAFWMLLISVPFVVSC